jgi:hypothetical protein
MSDTVTLALQGTVSLADFSAAVSRFHALIAALATDVQVEDVEWKLDGLDYSSAITTARGVPVNGSAPDRIERVVHAYLEVGEALESGATIPFRPPVQKEAQGLADLLKKSPEIEAVRFETAEAEAIVREPAIELPPDSRLVKATKHEASYGSVTGRVQTLSSRNSLRFVVYDHIHDRAVSCYLVEGRESMMRQMWDRVATVEGWVSRDPGTGRPLTVRQVSKVTPLTEVEPWDYLRARGVIPRGDNDDPPEAQIRRLRDA